MFFAPCATNGRSSTHPSFLHPVLFRVKHTSDDGTCSGMTIIVVVVVMKGSVNQPLLTLLLN